MNAKKFSLIIVLVGLALMLVSCRVNHDTPDYNPITPKVSEREIKKDDNSIPASDPDTDDAQEVNYKNELGERFSSTTPEAGTLFDQIWNSLKSSQGEFNTMDANGIVRLSGDPELATERVLEMGGRNIECYRPADDRMADTNRVFYDDSMFLRLREGDEIISYIVRIDSVPGAAFEELVALISNKPYTAPTAAPTTSVQTQTDPPPQNYGEEVVYINEVRDKFSTTDGQAEILFDQIWNALKSSQGEFNTMDANGIVRLPGDPELATERVLVMGSRNIECYRPADDRMADTNRVFYDDSMFLRLREGDEIVSYVVRIDSVPGAAFEELVALISKSVS